MKSKLHFLTILTSIFSLGVGYSQQFIVVPEKPIAGEKLTITYDPKGGPLEGIPFDAVFYAFENAQDFAAFDLDFKAENGSFMAEMEVPSKAKAISFGFLNNEMEKLDDNNGNGYHFLVHNKERTAPLPGALAVKASFYGSQSRRAGIKANHEMSLKLAKQELASHKNAINEKGFAWTYAYAAFKQQDELTINECRAIYQSIAKKEKPTEEELTLASFMATALEDKATQEALEKLAEEAYPNGSVAKGKFQKRSRSITKLEEKLAFYEEAKAKFGKEKDMEGFLNNIASTIANDYGQANDWTNFDKYFNQLTDKSRAAGLLNGLAWPMTGESLDGEAKDLDRALSLSAKSLELLQEEMKSLVSRPLASTPKSYRKNLEFSYAMYSDTYALLAYKKGKYADAFKYQTIACEQNKFGDGEMNERYCVYHEKVNGAIETEKRLAAFVAEGKATSKMKEQHKRLFLSNNSLESAYEKYATSLENEAKAKKRAEIEAKMLDENAPSFTLRNLKGEEVSMEKLRGKVLVLDFWATWCGPCKASFPGMQKAVNKFANHQDVEFLFIDTWENGTDKPKQAGDFIASKSYTFNVLMDLENTVVGQYKVDGIPTKFVVDKNGKIRFKSVGFNGNDDALVEELSTMIELVGGGVNP